MGMTSKTCVNGHVMNIGFVLCQVCNSVASGDNNSTDLADQTQALDGGNVNETADDPSGLASQNDV